MTTHKFTYPPYPFTTLAESEWFFVSIDRYDWIDVIDKISGEAKSFHPDDWFCNFIRSIVRKGVSND